MIPARPAPHGRGLPESEWPGLLLVDKPAGVTSHDVVAHARRGLHIRAIGHLGTLDPGASGLLVLALGAATRCAVVWQGGRKTYAGTVRFGVVTDTQDTDGRVLATSEIRPSESAVRAAAAALTGELAQVPPMVSALKHRGERLYSIARRGGSVEREARPVQVGAWRWLAFTGDEARFEVECSGGTYVRTLVHDLGQSLGSGAALASLRRLRSEPFSVEEACEWRDLDTGAAGNLLERRGIPLDRALDVLPALVLGPAPAEALGRGQAPRVEPGSAPVGAGPRSVVFRDAGGHALALGELATEGDGVRARPTVVFPWAVREGKVLP
jgi:tRNA pseudouridine55 synthase